MQVVGFGFTKIFAERADKNKPVHNINTDVQFLEIEKDKVDILKEGETLRFKFKLTIAHKDSDEKDSELLGECTFEGYIAIHTDTEEAKSILKGWKKKEIPAPMRTGLTNILIKKCAPKALTLEDDLNMPYHLPIPQVQMQHK